MSDAPTDDRAYWISLLDRLARPVLGALAKGELRRTMPVEHAPGSEDRNITAPLEAAGRLLCGMAPWLELADVPAAERVLHGEYRSLAQHGIAAAVDPASDDFMPFTASPQALVDTAFLAEAIIRAPRTLFGELPAATRQQIVDALASTRCHTPAFCNWLLFSATIEAALAACGREFDRMRIDYALRQHEQWYVGDGAYSDGPHFHHDYYNSFVIHPMMVDVLQAAGRRESRWGDMLEPVIRRAQRYAAVQERSISPEGTFPPLGRSITYRSGAFHLLAQMALQHILPDSVTPAQVRCALTAVKRRLYEAPGTFDDNGWLTIGLCGHQSALGERYITTGSVYLCAASLLPLGLPADDPFWADPPADWTSRRLWNGQDDPADHAID